MAVAWRSLSFLDLSRLADQPGTNLWVGGLVRTVWSWLHFYSFLSYLSQQSSLIKSSALIPSWSPSATLWQTCQWGPRPNARVSKPASQGWLRLRFPMDSLRLNLRRAASSELVPLLYWVVATTQTITRLFRYSSLVGPAKVFKQHFSSRAFETHTGHHRNIIGPYFNWALSVNRFWLVRRFSLFHTATSSFLECTRAANLGSPSNVGVELCSAMAILKVRAPWFNSREVGNWNRHGLAKKEC